MEALQYIYTSWKNGDSTEKGYMIYSRSLGISDAECTAIKDAMQYLAPKELMPAPTPQEIADIFPYAFSYFILPTGRGCVAQSTYLGKDYSGRYGNYIIYALIFEKDELPCRPAELFAESFMKTAMTDEELNAPSPVPPLPPLAIEEFASVINDDQLTEFLYDKEEEFAQLISMVLAARDLGIPFYLNDVRENLVLWSAALQRILPPQLATQFTFNTYVGDHEFMRSPRARDEGLNFHLIGVRPDANYFNYATESRSNRQIVMDFLGGYMTQGFLPSPFSQAMASSITMDYETIDSFGEFIEATSLREISTKLEDAYLYYQLLQNDEFEFTEEGLQALLNFGAAYCSDAINTDIGSKLLVKCQEEHWTLSKDLLIAFWSFICKHAGFMIFTLYDLFTDTIYQYAGDANGPCVQLAELVNAVKDETPQQYQAYLDYLNSAATIDHLLLYLNGHGNPYTMGFYITWLQENYSFSDGLADGQPISKLMIVLLNNLAHISGCEKQMLDILLAAADNRVLFENILRVFLHTLKEDNQLEKLCSAYRDANASLSERQLDQFERLLLDAPGATPLAIRLSAQKIASANDPAEAFWRFYHNQRARISSDSNFSIGPMVLACLEHVEEKRRDDVAIEMLNKLDHNLFTGRKVIKALTDSINACSVKELSKMESSFLLRVGQLREKADSDGLEKLQAVYLGKCLEESNAQRRRPVSLSEELADSGISLETLDRPDYEAYVKHYLDEYFVLLQNMEDLPVLLRIFYHEEFFSGTADDLISIIKKLEKRDDKRWARVLCWTCVYVVAADRDDQAAEALYKPLVRYLRTIKEDDIMDLRHAMTQHIPSTKFEYLFDEVRRKEGFTERLGNLFHKK